MMIKLCAGLIIILIAFFIFNGCIQISPDEEKLNKGYEFYEKREYDKAFPLYKESAESGNKIAQRYLGFMYARGEGVKRDDNEAVKWLSKAFKQSDIKSAYFIGLIYLNAGKTDENFKIAFDTFHYAATRNLPEAQFNLAIMYYRGNYVKRDYAKALEWYRKASENGDLSAKRNIASMYFRGEGVEKDWSKAFEFYKEVAEAGYAPAQYDLGLMFLKGYAVDKDEKKAFSWFQKAAEQGDTNGQRVVATMYYYGNGGVDRDLSKAFELFQLSATKGCSVSQYGLATMYLNGKGTEKDEEKAYEWFKKSAEGGEANAQVFLARSYAEGKPPFIEKDINKAIELFQKAISKEYLPAYNELAYLWAEQGTNLQEAETLIIKAIEKESDNGSYLDTYGWVLYKQEKFHEALKQLEKALGINPNSSVIRDHLGDTYLKLEMKDKTKEQWQKALELKPEDKLKDKITSKLVALEKAETVPAPAPSKEPSK